MPTRSEVEEIARHLHAVSGGPELRRKTAARTLARLHPTEATEFIQQLIELSRQGWEPAGCVLDSCVSALGLEASRIPFASELRRLAQLQALANVADLFPEASAVSQMSQDAAARADASLFTESLGHLKTRARLTRDRDEMARMAAVSNAQVMRNLLQNPRMTEDVVVRIAARRPARPEPLLEIWRTPRWFSRHAVKRALVFNPYLPPQVAAKIVPLLTGSDWRELWASPSVHQVLRDQARMLLVGTADPK
jgi:hypothetical protein